jgi:DNA-binding response OmpR family regulator
MSEKRDTILIIDDDPETRTLLREQVFPAKNFVVTEAKDGPEALSMLPKVHPDLIVLDLQLPGLSGRDMLVALQSQGYRGPLIVIADSGNERRAIETFRLGATDYVTRPIREAEVLAAVERGLAEVRLRRQRDDLVVRLQAINQELEARVNELTNLYNIGQSVTAMRDLEALFERVLDSAIAVTKADHAFLLLRDDAGRLILRAGRNLRLALLDRLGEAIQDQLADLVMTSREPLIVAGESLRRFTSARDLYAVAYVPLSVQNAAIGVLAIGNHVSQTPFSENHGKMLRMLADYAAIAMVNARLFSMLEQRAKAMETAYREMSERDAQRGRQLQVVLSRIYQPLGEIETKLNQIARDSGGKLPKEMLVSLNGLSQQVKQLAATIASLSKTK